MIHYITGDATKPEKRPTIIAHVCNDIGGWGAGFVVALSKRYPITKIAYKEWFGEGGNRFECKPVLGNIQIISLDFDLMVANMIAQKGIGKIGNVPPIRYEALEKCLRAVNVQAMSYNASITIPRIGAGLSGGKWSIIENIIKKTCMVDVYVYTLPSDVGKF